MSPPYTPPADARTAASLLLLRDGEPGLQVLMLRRAERAGDLRSGAVVFPGGVLDARDGDAHDWCPGCDDASESAQLGLAQGGLDYRVAALRETFEEVGLLLVEGGFDTAAVQPWRQRLQDGSAGMAEMCRALGLRLDAGALVYFSHWLTPPGLPKRFDTRFFAARAPAGQVAKADLGEALELMWLTPEQALQAERGLKLLPVTRRTLQELARSGSVDEALAAARSRGRIDCTMPRVAASTQGPRILLPDELAYAEVARLDPLGRHDASCELLPGRVVRLSARLWRITAPNPGLMTGPGTNSYIVGGDGRWVVVDPGPADPRHLQAVLDALAALGGRVLQILVTHTHRDHSPGAAALAQATQAPVWGRVALHPENQDTGFEPARQPEHGERIAIAADCSLRVLRTPGHAFNHVCYLLEQERTLLTGDHVMQGSTVVINPPDGDMSQYMRSLQMLLHEDLEWLAPGHGFLIAEPHARLRGLIAHRRQREALVLGALRQRGSARVEDLLEPVYAGTPRSLHPAAARSLLAHLIKLQQEGLVRRAGDTWSAA